MKIKLIQQLTAPNDNSGNPRRLWIVREIDTVEMKKVLKQRYPYASRVTMVIDQGYGNLPKDLEYDSVQDGIFRITIREYNEWIGYARKNEEVEFVPS